MSVYIFIKTLIFILFISLFLYIYITLLLFLCLNKYGLALQNSWFRNAKIQLPLSHGIVVRKLNGKMRTGSSDVLVRKHLPYRLLNLPSFAERTLLILLRRIIMIFASKTEWINKQRKRCLKYIFITSSAYCLPFRKIAFLFCLRYATMHALTLYGLHAAA